MVKPYPGRFIVFSQIDWSKIDDPNFSQEMVAQLDDAVARGARGLKILKDLGLGVKDKTGTLISVDDPRLDPIFAECGRLGIPVSLHVSDPEAFFHPIDNSNERYEELIEHPDWSFYGPQFPSKLSILEARDRIIARHPDTIFRRTAPGQLARESRLRFRGTGPISQYDGRIWRARGGIRPATAQGARVFLEVSGPDHVRHRQWHERRNVPKPLSLAGNSR